MRAFDLIGVVAAQLRGQRPHLPPDAGQRGGAQERPQRHRAAVLADHPVPCFQLDRAVTADHQLRRPAMHRDQIDAVAMVIGIMQLLRAALDVDRPIEDALLARPVLRSQL